MSDQDRLQNVTVMSCQHKDENGQFTYVKGDNKGNYICTICGNLCPHEHRSDNVCQDCGLLIGVVREKREPQYFDSFDHAWTQDWSMKYTLVRDQTSTTVLWTNSMTIDLNGCIFVQSTEGAGNGSTSISDGVTTVQNSAAKEGHYQGEVVVGGLREGDLADIEGGRQIAGVGVYDAPFGSLKITGNSTIQYAETGSAATLTADYETGTTMDEGKLTFAWYAVSADGTKTLIKNESGKSYVLPADLALGAYSYCVRVSCDGYVRESEPFGVTVGQRCDHFRWRAVSAGQGIYG